MHFYECVNFPLLGYDWHIMPSSFKFVRQYIIASKRPFMDFKYYSLTQKFEYTKIKISITSKMEKNKRIGTTNMPFPEPYWWILRNYSHNAFIHDCLNVIHHNRTTD